QCLHDTAGNLVAGSNTAKDVYEYGVDLLVTQDHVETIGHDLCVSATTNVQEVGWFDVAVVFPGVCDDVQCGHNQSGTVTNNTNGTVELHVVEAFGFSFGFERVFGAFVNEFSVCWLTEVSVVIHGDFSVKGNELAFAGEDQWVDFNQGGVFFLKDFTKFDKHISDIALHVVSEFSFFRNLLCDFAVQTGGWRNWDACQIIWTLFCQLLDVHSAFYRCHSKVGAVGAIQQHREVVLFFDVSACSDHHLVNGVTFNIHAQNFFGIFVCFVSILGDFDTAGQAAATYFDLGFDNGNATEFFSGGFGIFRCFGNDPSQHGYPVCFKKIACLVLIQVHEFAVLLPRQLIE